MRFALIVSLACALGIARAEEPAAAPAAGDAIDLAKRDFDAIKAERDRALHSKGELRISTPELQVEGLEPRLLDQSTRKKKLLEKELAERKAKAAHWLIDAMEKEKNLDSEEKSGVSRSDREKIELVREQDRTLDLLRGEKAEDQSAFTSSGTDAKTAKDTRPAAPVINPLTRYMGDWMTSQDFALLKSNLGDGAAKDAFTPGGALPGSGSTPATDLGSAGGIEASLGAIGSPRGTSSLPSAPRDNPFLAGLGSVGAPTTVLSLPPNVPLGPPPGGPSVLVNRPPEPPPARSNVPDFAKPSVDDKYFKPLKRF